MNSAFGIDHGEIEKAFGRRRRTTGPPPTNAQRAGFPAGAKHVRSGAGKLRSAAGKVGNAKVSINDIGTGVGRGVGAVGRVATKSPTAAGLAVIGGGGYAAYRALQDPGLPKKRRNQ